MRVQGVPCVGRCAGAPVAVVGQRTRWSDATPSAVRKLVARGATSAEAVVHQNYASYREKGGYALLADCHRGEHAVDD